MLVHSFSGRTLAAAEAVAGLTGGHLIAYGDPPAPSMQARGPALTSLPIWQKGLPPGVRRVFLGYPIWGYGEPSEPAVRLVGQLDWRGIEVVPFYTYSHDAQPAPRQALCAVIAQRGGQCLPHLDLLVDTWSGPERISKLVQAAFLSQSNWWSIPVQDPPTKNCHLDQQGHWRCRVPAGPVWLGDGPDTAAMLPKQVTVASFEMDAAEITAGQWQACVAAGRCPPNRGADSFCQTLLEAGPKVAMPCLSARDVETYCASRDMRLPTEAEWIRAARGGTATAFPWGQDFWLAGQPPRGNFGERRGEGLPRYSLVAADAAWPRDGVTGLAAPCQFPAGLSPFGLCDMAGNLAEWTRDSGGLQLKGGLWFDNRAEAYHVGGRAWYGGPPMQDYPGSYVSGGRCARSIAPGPQ